jgi:molybdopterin-guanine dinucleotide biosynthesis protein B
MEQNVPERGRHTRTPVLTFVGRSGTGKTTFLEQLIPALRNQGLRVAVVKHDAHQFEMDHPGKDTWRFSQAGADVVAISSPQKIAVLEQPQRELTLNQVISRLPDVDLILTEGYRSEHNPKIELHRKALNVPLLTPEEELIAVLTDEPLPLSVPQLALDDVPGCVDLILRWIG